MTNPSSIHPSSVFHFTNNFNALQGILKDKSFRISYARENFSGINKHHQSLVPMVSFCDIRIADLKNHIESYGNYGVGLSKKWAEKSRLSPVLYISQDSPIADDLIYSLQKLPTLLKLFDPNWQQKNEEREVYLSICRLRQYVKNYEGRLDRKDNAINNYRFSDEREWRYVLREHVYSFVPQANYTDDQKKQANKNIEKERLSFGIEDLRYIIVESSSEMKELIGEYLDDQYIPIFTKTQILEDF